MRMDVLPKWSGNEAINDGHTNGIREAKGSRKGDREGGATESEMHHEDSHQHGQKTSLCNEISASPYFHHFGSSPDHCMT